MDVNIYAYDQELVFHAGVGDETKVELASILLIPEVLSQSSKRVPLIYSRLTVANCDVLKYTVRFWAEFMAGQIKLSRMAAGPD